MNRPTPEVEFSPEYVALRTRILTTGERMWGNLAQRVGRHSENHGWGNITRDGQVRTAYKNLHYLQGPVRESFMLRAVQIGAVMTPVEVRYLRMERAAQLHVERVSGVWAVAESEIFEVLGEIEALRPAKLDSLSRPVPDDPASIETFANLPVLQSFVAAEQQIAGSVATP